MPSNITGKVCFPPVCDDDVRILILGSFPGETSLAEQKYYAHPRNTFWNIMDEILGIGKDLEYNQKIAAMKKNRVGLWDVMNRCRRDGSLDANIQAATIVTNDFHTFFRNYSSIRAIFFNGSRAEAEFKKRVLPTLGTVVSKTTMHRLPSTSPAMAMLSYEEKREAWKMIVNYL